MQTSRRSLCSLSNALVILGLVACTPAVTPSPTLSPVPSVVPTMTTLPTGTPPSTPVPSPTPTPTPRSASAPPDSRPLTISYIQMIDRSTGWAEGFHGTVGHTRILRTMDGGETWRDMSPGALVNFGRSAFFLDTLVAWAWSAESGETWSTQDGGESWTPTQQADSRFDVWFNDSQHGWRANAAYWGVSFLEIGFDFLESTQNGGRTWQPTNPPPGNGYAYLAFPEAQTAWALQTDTDHRDYEGFAHLEVPWSLEVTTDGGRTWQSHSVPVPPDARLRLWTETKFYLDLGLCDFVAPVYASSTIWKLALTCENHGWMYTTANQGKTWAISLLPEGSLIQGIQFLDPKVGWMLRWNQLGTSLGRLYLTTDGGETWTLLKHTEWAAAQFNFVDAGTGWAVASTCTEFTCNRFGADTVLVKTTDGGRTWQALEPQLAP